MESTGGSRGAHPEVSEHGLKEDAIGFRDALIIGIASTAPAYSLAAVIGLVVVTVGVQAPAVLFASFVPMFFVATAFYYMNRAGVIGHTLWVTPFREDERWPCGEFVNQSEEDAGLTRWTEQNRSIENTDVVLWYVFGLHHITRPEEWPVMPVDTVSFWLKPAGFFDRNPALDVPPTSNGHCHNPHDTPSESRT